jgi:hypothetical protein
MAILAWQDKAIGQAARHSTQDRQHRAGQTTEAARTMQGNAGHGSALRYGRTGQWKHARRLGTASNASTCLRHGKGKQGNGKGMNDHHYVMCEAWPCAQQGKGRMAD